MLKLPSIPTLAPGAIEPLMNYHWPGNVRELENVIERALILSQGGPLSFDHLVLPSGKGAPDSSSDSAESYNLEDVVARHIRRVLTETKGKVHGPGGASELLGINPSTLRSRMNKLGIEYGRKSNY